MHKLQTSDFLSQVQALLPDSSIAHEEANLIELGLDSLHIMRLVNDWRRKGVAVTFAQLIERPFLKHWRELLESAHENTISNEARKTSHTDEVEISHTPTDAPFALTDVQHAYWIGRKDGQPLGGVGCHAYLEISGHGVQPSRLGAAWELLFAQHAMLRTRFCENGTQQVFADFIAPSLVTHDFRLLSPVQVDAELIAVRERMSHRRLNVANAQVAGLELSLLPDGNTLIHFDIDLLVADVQSLHIVLRAYQGKALAADPNWRFSHYLQVEAERQRDQQAAASRYWSDCLAHIPSGPKLPLLKASSSISRPRFVRRSHHLSNSQWQTLRLSATKHGITPALMLATAYAEILGRWSSEAVFSLNLPLFDRKTDHVGIEHAVADFTNLLLLRCDCSQNVSFSTRANALQQQFHRDVAHASYSAVSVLRDLIKQGLADAAAAPVVFACNLGTPLLTQDCKDTLGTLHYMISQTPQVWLDHQVYEDEDGLLLAWDAVEDLFPDGLLDDMFTGYIELLQWLAESNDHWQELLPQLLPEYQVRKRAEIVETVPMTHMPLHEGMFSVAARSPERTALIFGDITISYGELAHRAKQVTALLRQHGVQTGDTVAVNLPRGFEQVVAAYGILAAGGCYVPVSVNQPSARQMRIYQTANVKLVLTSTAGIIGETQEGIQRIDIDQAWKFEPVSWCQSVNADASAYIIFTSGSTGEPKGVEVTHAAAVNTISTINARYGVHSDSRILAVSSLDFDLSVYDIFGLLGVGGAAILLEEEQRRDAVVWLELIHQHQITVWNSVPVLLDMLLVIAVDDSRLLPFEQVFLSGDWIGLDLPERLFTKVTHDAKLIAMGGATEAAIWSNAFDVSLPLPEHWRSIPYGKPLANQRYRVVDIRGWDCPDWVSGELWIGGAGVAVGYRGDSKQTAERFVEYQGGRWYRTGDMGRYWPDGNLEFLGRRDHQVKVRGHRIELGEIEAALMNLPGVCRAVAVTIGNPTMLAVAYVPHKSGQAPDADDLKVALRHLLPDYMVPGYFKAIDEIPLSTNGKIDRNLLTQWLSKSVDEQEEILGEPCTDNEKRVSEIWKKLLGCKKLGRESNFFSLGGDSLLATRLISKLQEQGLTAEQPLRMLFSQPRLMDFAAELLPIGQGEKKHIRADPVHRYEPFPLTEIQRAYWMGQSPGLVLNSSTHYLLELDGVDVDLERMEGAWNRLIQHHDMMRVVVENAEQQKILAQVPIQSIVRSHALQHGAKHSLDAARQYLKSCWNQLSLTHDRGKNWPPFRICAAAYGENRCRIGIIFDYLTLDGYSIKLLLDQLALLYINPQASLPVTEISFRDYVLHVQPKPETQARSEAFWREKLSDLPLAPALPLAVDPVDLQEPQFLRREAIISRSQWTNIKERARKNQITASVFLLTAYSQIIRRWSGDDDFTLNLTLFDRQNVHPDVEKLLGDFTSLTPIAFRLSNGADLLSQARATQSEIAAALEHREISSIWIQRERARDMGLVAAALPVVFTSTLGLGGGLFEKSSPSFPILATGGLSSTPQIWLDHQLYEYDGELVVSWDAVEGLFPDGMLDVMFKTYVDLLANLATDDWTQPVSIPLPEGQVKIRKASEQVSPSSPAALLHTRMFNIAVKQPQRTALIAADMSISYSDLAQKSLRIAAMLQQNGMRSGDAVAVNLPRGIGQICAVFGILAAGGCYVPIGIHQPDVRRAKIYATAGIRWEIGARTDAATIDDITALTRLTVEQAEAFEPLSAPLPSTPDDSAYIIFTSGSTGEPKGVEVTHVAAANTIDVINSRYEIHANSRVLAVSALDFDLSVYDIFGLLSVGGAVVLLDEEQRRDAAVWLDLIHRHQVTIWNSVPVLLEMLLVAAATDSRSFSFEQVFLSGDWIGLDLPKRLFAKSTHDTKLVAMGGATEAAIWSNAFDVSVPLPEHWRSIPYGKPLANQRYRVVDTQGQDCPDWVPGELWIGGAGVAVGYRGDPKQTIERFVEYQGERWYRTGDMGRYWSDGNLEFLGRRDHQVKVRGHRIELGEVEAALANLLGIARAIALTIGNPAVLAVVYVPVDHSTTPAANELASTLRNLLPDYMVPTYLQAIDDIPLSANGKVDRKLLAQLFSENGQEKESILTAPETDVEVRLAEIWKRLLKCDHIGRESSFFSLGGDSLLATQLIAELGSHGLGTEQPLRLLFTRPVLMDFAAALTQIDVKQVAQITPVPEQKYSPFPLTEVQRAYWMGRSSSLPLTHKSEI